MFYWILRVCTSQQQKGEHWRPKAPLNVSLGGWSALLESPCGTPERKHERCGVKVNVCLNTFLDEKPPCFQWGETENLHNMAALCCNASTLLRAALSLPLFIISRNQTPAMHCVWGKKIFKKVCVFVSMHGHIHVYVFFYVHVLCSNVKKQCVCVCVCVSPPRRHPY